MNQTVVDKIVEQLNRVNSIAEVKQIVVQKQIRNFNSDYLIEEFRKITSARNKNFPTYRSEYRVTKTLIRLRNEILYELNKTSPMFNSVSSAFIDLSKYLFDTLADVSSIFEAEKNISAFAEEFDNTWMN